MLRARRREAATHFATSFSLRDIIPSRRLRRRRDRSAPSLSHSQPLRLPISFFTTSRSFRRRQYHDGQAFRAFFDCAGRTTHSPISTLVSANTLSLLSRFLGADSRYFLGRHHRARRRNVRQTMLEAGAFRAPPLRMPADHNAISKIIPTRLS